MEKQNGESTFGKKEPPVRGWRQSILRPCGKIQATGVTERECKSRGAGEPLGTA